MEGLARRAAQWLSHHSGSTSPAGGVVDPECAERPGWPWPALFSAPLLAIGHMPPMRLIGTTHLPRRARQAGVGKFNMCALFDFYGLVLGGGTQEDMGRMRRMGPMGREGMARRQGADRLHPLERPGFLPRRAHRRRHHRLAQRRRHRPRGPLRARRGCRRGLWRPCPLLSRAA